MKNTIAKLAILLIAGPKGWDKWGRCVARNNAWKVVENPRSVFDWAAHARSPSL